MPGMRYLFPLSCNTSFQTPCTDGFFPPITWSRYVQSKENQARVTLSRSCLIYVHRDACVDPGEILGAGRSGEGSSVSRQLPFASGYNGKGQGHGNSPSAAPSSRNSPASHRESSNSPTIAHPQACNLHLHVVLKCSPCSPCSPCQPRRCCGFFIAHYGL